MECVNAFKYYPLGMHKPHTSFRLFLMDGLFVCSVACSYYATQVVYNLMALLLSSPPPCLNCRYPPLSLLSLCSCHKTQRNQLGRTGFIHPAGFSSSLREVKMGTQGRNLKKTVEECCLLDLSLVCSGTFFI